MSDHADTTTAGLTSDELPAVIIAGSPAVARLRARDRATSRVETAISGGVLAAVAFTALAHGAVEPWSIAIFKLIILGLLLLWAVKWVKEGRVSVNVPHAALPAVALLTVGLAQSFGLTDGSGRMLSFSMDVEATRSSVTVVFFLVVSFLMAASFFTSRGRLQGLTNFLAVYGLAMAVFALVQHFTWDGNFYWIRPNTQSVSPFGPFVNHNHFAGYMELLMPVPLAVAVTGGASREARIFYGFAAAVMGVATITSLSRGGILSMIAGMLFVVMMSRRLRSSSRDPRRFGGLTKWSAVGAVSRIAAVGIISAAVIAGVFWIGPDPVIDRVAQGSANASNQQTGSFFVSRGWIWRDTVSMIKSNPVTGVGLGAYQTAYPIYSRSDGSLLVGEAHNDYLQILADCGIVGAAIAVWFIIAIFRAVWRGVRAEDQLMAGVALGCGAGIFSILVHSVIDFNLQLPSNALLFLILAAVASHIGSLRAAVSE